MGLKFGPYATPGLPDLRACARADVGARARRSPSKNQRLNPEGGGGGGEGRGGATSGVSVGKSRLRVGRAFPGSVPRTATPR